MCAFDSALNFEETDSKKVPLVAFGLRPNVTKKLANSFFFLKNVANFQEMLRRQRVNEVPKQNKLPKSPQKWVYFAVSKRNTLFARKIYFSCGLC